jgi:hypothetical protein
MKRERRQLQLREVAEEIEADGKSPSKRISHLDILREIEQAALGSRGVVEIYRCDVLSVPVRTIQLLGRKCPARIIHTLLGYEVQGSYKRVHCPDLVTARYLKLFMEIGCRSIRLPYDPTHTGRVADELEEALERISRGISARFPSGILSSYVFRRICATLRRRLAAA